MTLATQMMAILKPKDWIADNFERLAGSIVFAPPLVGHDLVVIPTNLDEQSPINLGRVISMQIDDGAGYGFNVITDMCPTKSEGNALRAQTLYVRLIDGATAYLSNQR